VFIVYSTGHRSTYPVFFQLLAVQLGLELQGQGLLEVDGPDGLAAADLGGSDFAAGNGENDRLGQDGKELVGDPAAGLRNPELAPVFTRPGINVIKLFTAVSYEFS
jgi:hypothetical protein